MGKKAEGKSGVDRRSFLAGIATVGAAAVAAKPDAAGAAEKIPAKVSPPSALVHQKDGSGH